MGSWTILISFGIAVLGGIGFILGRRHGRTAAIVLGLIGFALGLLSVVAFYLTQGRWGYDGGSQLVLLLVFAVSVAAVIIGANKGSPAQPSKSIVGGPERTNGLALASIIVVWFSSLIGLILGHVALGQIKRTGEAGQGMALTAVVAGWVLTAIGAIATIALFTTYGALLQGSY